MKIELKRISYNKRLSQETHAYSADIWVNGVKRGTVQNSGQGGPDNIFPRDLAHEIEAYAKTLPQVDCHGTKLDMCAEILFGDMMNAHIVSTEIKRIMKTKLLFVSTDGKMYSVKGTVAPKDAVKVLNTLPFDEAVELFRKHNG